MKSILLLFVLVALTACNNVKQARAKSRTGSGTASLVESRGTLAEERRRSVREETEVRAKSFERQGYSAEDARALAEVEYFRSGGR